MKPLLSVWIKPSIRLHQLIVSFRDHSESPASFFRCLIRKLIDALREGAVCFRIVLFNLIESGLKNLKSSCFLIGTLIISVEFCLEITQLKLKNKNRIKLTIITLKFAHSSSTVTPYATEIKKTAEISTRNFILTDWELKLNWVSPNEISLYIQSK